MENNDANNEQESRPVSPEVGLNQTFPYWNQQYPIADEVLTNRQGMRYYRFKNPISQAASNELIFPLSFYHMLAPMQMSQMMLMQQSMMQPLFQQFDNASENPLNQAIDLSFQNSAGFSEAQFEHNMSIFQPSIQLMPMMFPPPPEQFRLRSHQPSNMVQTNQNERYYKLSTSPPIEQPNFDPSEHQYLKITVTKSSNAQMFNPSQEYIVTAFGLIGSEKNTEVEDIVIGRCQNQEFNQRRVVPNDIVLSPNDRAISRVHCKIVTKFAFNAQDPYSQELILFLRICKSERLWSALPKHLMILVWQFAKPPKNFYLQDIGSVYGTYIKLSHMQPQPIQRLQTYFVGADNTFNILECQTEEDLAQQQKQGNQDLINKLVAQSFLRTNIHGLYEEEYKAFDATSERFQQERQQSNDTYISQPFGRPYLLIEFKSNQQNEDSANLQHIFFGPPTQQDMNVEHPQTIFRIGRGGEDNNVRIAHNTISRKQCRFWYCQMAQKWFICDGDTNRESSNGTWLSLQNCLKKEQGEPRQESELWPLQHGNEIKVSESILKVEMFNMYKKYSIDKHSRKKPTQQLPPIDELLLQDM